MTSEQFQNAIFRMFNVVPDTNSVDAVIAIRKMVGELRGLAENPQAAEDRAQAAIAAMNEAIEDRDRLTRDLLSAGWDGEQPVAEWAASRR